MAIKKEEKKVAVQRMEESRVTEMRFLRWRILSMVMMAKMWVQEENTDTRECKVPEKLGEATRDRSYLSF